MTPKEVVDEIRNLWSVDSKDPRITHYRVQLHNALERLSRDLYTRQTHFVLELIQNADDNAYSAAVEPALRFVISNDAVLVVNNEIGFSAENVESLCAVGQSTKSKRLGFIGEKGIGFKSVFRITDEPHIFSNGYSFKFSLTEENDPLGFVVPHWIEDIPQFVKHGQTTIYLPLRATAQPVFPLLEQVDSRLLLFLGKLEELDIEDCSTGKHRLVERVILSSNRIKLHDSYWKDGKPERKPVTRLFFVSKRTMAKPTDLVEAERSEVSETTLALAFPLREDGRAEGPNIQDVFAFLPTRPYGFRFIIQADFLVPASREDLHKDSSWNQWLRDNIAEAFLMVLPSFKEDPQLKHTFYAYLPVGGEVTDEFFLPVVSDLYSSLRAAESLQGETGNWYRPEQLLRAERDTRTLIPNTELKQLLGVEYLNSKTNAKVEVLDELRCVRFSEGHLTKCLENETWLQAKPDDWLSSLYAWFSRHFEKGDNVMRFRQTKMLRLEDGRLTSLAEGEVFFPPETKVRYGFEHELRTLRPGTFGSGDQDEATRSRQFLVDLGVKACTSYELIEGHILPLYQSDRWKTRRPEVLRGHVCYIKDHLEAYLSDPRSKVYANPLHRLQKTLLLASNSSTESGSRIYSVASGLYLSPQYGAHCELPRLLEGIDGIKVVSNEYSRLAGVSEKGESKRSAETAENDHEWPTFLKRLGVNAVPRLEQSANSVGRGRSSVVIYDYDLSAEFQAIVNCQAKMDSLLRFLDEVWTGFYRRFVIHSSAQVPSFVTVLRKMRIQTMSGERWHLCDCIVNSPVLQNLFGGSLPALGIPLHDSNFIKDMGVAVDINVAFGLARLQLLQSNGNNDRRVVEKLYRFLMQRFDEDPEGIRKAFTDQPLILIHGSTARYVRTTEVIWRDLGSVFESKRQALQHQYPGLKEFFVGQLGVAEDPDIQDIGATLERLAAKQSISEEEAKIVRDIYFDLATWLEDSENSDRAWFEELSTRAIFLTHKNEFKLPIEVLVNDDEAIAAAFAKCPEISFLGVPIEDQPDLATFILTCGIRYLSKVVIAKSTGSTASLQHEEWSGRLKNSIEHVARYLWSKMHDDYLRLRDGGAFSELAQLNCYTVQHLMVTYEVDRMQTTANKQVLVENGTLFVDLTATDEFDLIAEELSRFLGGNDELSNFISLLFAKGTSERIGKLFESRKISPLPVEEARYIEALLAGTQAKRPERKGILANLDTVKTEESGEFGDSANVAQQPSGDELPPTQARTLTEDVSSGPQERQESAESKEIVVSTITEVHWDPGIAPEGAQPGGEIGFSYRDQASPTEKPWEPDSELARREMTGGESGAKERLSNEARYAIGHWGEEWLTKVHLKEKFRKQYPGARIEDFDDGFDVISEAGRLKTVQWMNSQFDTLHPYDIVIKSAQGAIELYIEVKSTRDDKLSWFDMSLRQWEFAQNHRNFSLYRVYNAGTLTPMVAVIDDPAQQWKEGNLFARPVRIYA